MLCPYCGAELDRAAFCPHCGKPRPVYAAPEGFTLDRELGLWFREETLAPVGGTAVTVLTQFDPVSGSYTQTRREVLAPAPAPPTPMPEAIPAPAPEPKPEPLPQGFTPDPDSGLAYRLDSLLETPLGPVIGLTWYDPATRAYAQARHRPVAAPTPEPTPAAGRAAAPRRKWGWGIALGALCLLLAVGVWAFMDGRLPIGIDEDGRLGLTSATEPGEGTQPEGFATRPSKASDSPGATNPSTTEPEATQPPAGDTAMADATMEAAVRQLLRIKEDSAVTDEHLAQLTFAMISHNGVYLENDRYNRTVQGDVTSLDDLLRMPNLLVLHIFDYDLQPELDTIGTLTQVKQLYIYADGLSDISALGGLGSLGTLDISDNQVTDLSPLAGLDQVGVLYIDNNPIYDLSPLADMDGLRTLNAADIPATDWSPVTHLGHVVGMPDALAEEIDKARAGGSYVYTRGVLEMAELGIDATLQDTLWLYSDGIFDMEINLGSSMGHLNGTWKSEGYVFILAIDTWNFEQSVPAEAIFLIDTLAEGGTITLDGPDIGPFRSGTTLLLTEIY